MTFGQQLSQLRQLSLKAHKQHQRDTIILMYDSPCCPPNAPCATLEIFLCVHLLYVGQADSGQLSLAGHVDTEPQTA